MAPGKPPRPPRRSGGKPAAGGRGKPPPRNRSDDRRDAAKKPGRPAAAGTGRTAGGRRTDEERLERDRQGKARDAGWGGVARKGAGRLDGRPMGAASEAWRDAVSGSTGEAWQPEQWIDEGDVRKEASRAVGRGKRPDRARDHGPDRGPQPSRRKDEPAPREDASAKGLGQAKAARLEDRQKHAIEAFKRQRFDEARRLLKPLAEMLPASELVRELNGLTLYRLGRWKQAAGELEAFRSLAGSTEQHPVLADCYRALGRHAEVEQLWDELREASPRADLVAEGRIVMAGSLADQGRLADAIEVLSRAKLPSKRPQEHHLRVAYALADLYERAGETPRARELFMVVATNDAEFADVRSRLRNLR